MSGNYPDGVTQASFDRYWSDKLDDDDTSPLDEPPDIERFSPTGKSAASYSRPQTVSKSATSLKEESND